MSGDQQVEVRGAEFAVRRMGTGIPFVWGHGLQMSMSQEDEARLFDWSALTGDVELIRYDARGHGDSTGGDGPDAYTWPEMAADLLALLDALDVDRAVIGGASMGSAIALQTAVAAPERVRALVLVIPPTAWDTRPAQQRTYRLMAGLTGSRAFRLAMPLIARVPVPAATPGTRQALVRAGFHHVQQTGGRGMAEPFIGASRSDLPPLDVLAGIEAPTLVLAWRDDGSHPLSTAERLADTLPDATLRVARSDAAMLTWPTEIRRFLADHRVLAN